MRNLLTVFFALCTLNTITVSARPAFDYSALRDGTFEQKTVSGVRSLSDGERYIKEPDRVTLERSALRIVRVLTQK